MQWPRVRMKEERGKTNKEGKKVEKEKILTIILKDKKPFLKKSSKIIRRRFYFFFKNKLFLIYNSTQTKITCNITCNMIMCSVNDHVRKLK